MQRESVSDRRTPPPLKPLKAERERERLQSRVGVKEKEEVLPSVRTALLTGGCFIT
jgi:hypothetical protein